MVTSICVIVPELAVLINLIQEPAGIVASLNPELIVCPVVVFVIAVPEEKTFVRDVMFDPKAMFIVTEGEEPITTALILETVISTCVFHNPKFSAEVGLSIVMPFD